MLLDRCVCDFMTLKIIFLLDVYTVGISEACRDKQGLSGWVKPDMDHDQKLKIVYSFYYIVQVTYWVLKRRCILMFGIHVPGS